MFYLLEVNSNSFSPQTLFSPSKNESEKRKGKKFFTSSILPLLFQKRNWKKKENPRIVGDRFEGKQKKRSAFGETRHVGEKTEKGDIE